MKRASAVMIGMALVFALFSVVRAAGYTFTALDYPGAGHTEAWGINNSGLIVGYYDQNTGQDFEPHGFLLKGAVWRSLDYPGAIWTFGLGINDQGTVVGTYVSPGGVAFGYSLKGTTYNSIASYPTATETYVYSINNSGTIVGWLSGFRPDVPQGLGGYYGFSLTGGVYTMLDYPDSPGVVFNALGINDGGMIVGQCLDFDGTHCCSLTGSTLAFHDRPGADSIVAWDVNKPGTIVGEYTDAAGTHGFTLSGGTWATIDYPGASETVVHGINDTGSIVGSYVDSTGIHGFLATPVSDLLSVSIDIRPWSRNNLIDYRSHGLIPVAILSSRTFDAFQTANLDRITFGHTGNENSMAFCSPWDWDINGDGYGDLLCFFRTSAADFTCSDTAGTLKGTTDNGTAFEGKETIAIVPCRAASR
jgi:uncharacterized membrane protein